MIRDEALTDPGPRPPGPVVGALGRVFPGVRAVQAQAGPYAAAWARSNAAALSAAGPMWVALGDSLVLGVGASEWDRGWVGQLSARLAAGGRPHRVVNLAGAGATLDALVRTQLPELDRVAASAGPAALVTVAVGADDIASPVRRRGLAKRFAELLDRLPPRAVVLNLPTPHREARLVDGLLAARAAAGRLVVADLRGEGPRSWRGLLAADGFHPNDDGYARIADVVERAVQRAGLPEQGDEPPGEPPESPR